MKRTNYWLISDTHLGHNKLVKDGYRQEGFEDIIIKNCVKLINEKDIFIHLGDVSFYKDEYYHELLLTSVGSYKNILVLGNHDRRTLSWYYNRGWTFVCNAFYLEIYGYRLVFTHKPLPCFSIVNSLTSADVIDFNIHGHLHDGSYRKDETTEFHKLVSIEETMSPIKLDKLIGV